MNPPAPFCVIGSGPAGIAAASALLAAGQPVVMLDVGYELEPERQQQLSQFQTPPHHWDPKATDRVFRNGMAASSSGIPEKTVYGSLFPYKDAIPEKTANFSDAEVKHSYAQGGLSNVWGASILPYQETDLKGWPIQLEQLKPHYRAIQRLLQPSVPQDSLSKHFPLLQSTEHTLLPSDQATSMLKQMEKHVSRLRGAGFAWGQSRLAVNAKDCLYCGLCIYGCPHELIYSASHTLQQLKQCVGFQYCGNFRVDRLEECSKEVRVHGVDLVTGMRSQRSFRKVLLGAGALSTARIMLNSMPAFSSALTLRCSDYFLLPFLRFRRSYGARKEPLHTLAQLFVELDNATVSSERVHLQFYTYNDLYPEAIKRLFGPLGNLATWASNPLLERLLVIQGYIHSNSSSKITVRAAGSDTTVSVHGVNNPLGSQIISKVSRLIFRHAKSLGGVPISPMLQRGIPGQGAHVGGSFPMSQHGNPERSSDLLGRPAGFQHLHLIDASVFPTIPAPTITFTIMANAHRIASKLGRAATSNRVHATQESSR